MMPHDSTTLPESKRCSTCKELREASWFYVRGNRLESQCKQCKAEGRRRWRLSEAGQAFEQVAQTRYVGKKRASQAALAIRYRQQKRSLIRDYKRQHGCLICKENEPACLDFHHRDPALKTIAIANWGARPEKADQLPDEIDKCVVLCANCHRKLHAGLVSIPD